MTKDKSERRPPPPVRLPVWASVGIGLGLFAILMWSGVWLFGAVRDIAADWQITAVDSFEPGQTEVTAPGDPAAPVIMTENGEPVTDESTLPLLYPADVTVWDGRERVTVLLLGVDQRCEEEGPTRTDSLMVVTIDPVGKTAGILSLPRDLWVEIPGFGVDRINQAHYFGEGFQYPGGGPELARETVAATLGIEIDYYMTVNFDAFVEVVDLLGGLTLNVPESINDPDYPDSCYGFDPFSISAGQQTLDGATALKYARTRETEGGDVDRAGRQQLVVLAARDQAVDRIPQLITQAPALWQTLQDNVQTTMTLEEAVQLALLMQEIPRERINQAVIDYNYVYVEVTPDGQNVLVPIRENIRALRDELFSPPETPLQPIEDLAEQLADEGARVAVYNGTSVFGLAGETQAYLVAEGVNVVEVGNADEATFATSQIIDYGDHPYTIQYLLQLMDIPRLNVSEGREPDGEFDLLIILGNDWSVPSQ